MDGDDPEYLPTTAGDANLVLALLDNLLSLSAIGGRAEVV